jgi:predicted nucleotidyltransferase
MEERNTSVVARTMALMQSVFARKNRLRKAVLHGSSAMGNHRKGLEIGLSRRGDIDYCSTVNIAGELDDLPPRYKFDVNANDAVSHRPPRYRSDRVGIPIYRRAPSRRP